MKHRTLCAVARWVPKVLIGKRSAVPGGDERKVSGEGVDSCGSAANWRRALLNLTWLTLYDHENIDKEYFTAV